MSSHLPTTTRHSTALELHTETVRRYREALEDPSRGFGHNIGSAELPMNEPNAYRHVSQYHHVSRAITVRLCVRTEHRKSSGVTLHFVGHFTHPEVMAAQGYGRLYWSTVSRTGNCVYATFGRIVGYYEAFHSPHVERLTYWCRHALAGEIVDHKWRDGPYTEEERRFVATKYYFNL